MFLVALWHHPRSVFKPWCTVLCTWFCASGEELRLLQAVSTVWPVVEAVPMRQSSDNQETNETAVWLARCVRCVRAPSSTEYTFMLKHCWSLWTTSFRSVSQFGSWAEAGAHYHEWPVQFLPGGKGLLGHHHLDCWRAYNCLSHERYRYLTSKISHKQYPRVHILPCYFFCFTPSSPILSRSRLWSAGGDRG